MMISLKIFTAKAKRIKIADALDLTPVKCNVKTQREKVFGYVEKVKAKLKITLRRKNS